MIVNVEKIASLARLEIDAEQLPKFQKKLEDIIGMVEKLPDLSAVKIELDAANPMVLRKDEIGPSLKRDQVLANAPKTEAGCVVVPKTVD